MIIRIIKISAFIVFFSSCYFLSCSTFININRNPCEDACSRNNIECSRNCEEFYASIDPENAPAGNGCEDKDNLYSCLEGCDDNYSKCIKDCKTMDWEKTGKKPGI